MIKLKAIFITVIYCTLFLTPHVNAKPSVTSFEKPFLEDGYKSVGEAIRECETVNQRELHLPIKFPPIEFTHHLGRCVNDNQNYNDELQIEYLHETQSKNHFKIDVRPLEQRINFENSKRDRKKLRLNDGSDALYFSTNPSGLRRGFNILVFEKNGWQYLLAVDSRMEDQVTVEELIGIANSLR
ncbi:hypothetical protein PghCCS26_62000 [Paenibacillus glycanilyticus]|uniref:DUF4367 domain-containing protein n=1 Tax=Paenibacillus glycanilyticus TaxID=126569 RepID=A0ABQ6NVF5_9BACL|nr:hypothetical protein [Paenibacillus glycanilyticus]GMK49070.1 hypothetical protein PghCCS26_62000 [Paenibacillus glycanilyticus]